MMINLLKKISALALAMLMVFSMSAVAFAEDDDEAPEYDLEYYQRFMGQKVSINVYNWGEYISNGSDDSLDVNKAFEELTGIKVNYTNFATNEELYAKLRTGGASYDIIVPSDYMIGRMISEDMLLPINFDNVPNFQHTNEEFRNQPYDPENKYSIPYTWGTVGIVYNTTMVDEEITSWDILWNPNYMGDILMFSNPRDAFGIAQKMLGLSQNPSTEEELRAATNLLKEQKYLVQAYVMDEIFDKMTGGEAALAPYYAGDALTMIDDNPDLDFVVPNEGTNRFLDAICIPKGAKNQEAAEMYINFLCEPDVAAANIDYIGYSTPNIAAFELLDEEVSSDPISYPPQEILEKTEYFLELPNEINVMMDKMWTEVLSTDAEYSQWLIPMLLVVSILLSIGINVARGINKKRRERIY